MVLARQRRARFDGSTTLTAGKLSTGTAGGVGKRLFGRYSIVTGIFGHGQSDYRGVYGFWVRFLTFAGVAVVTIVLVGTSFMTRGTEAQLPWNEEKQMLGRRHAAEGVLAEQPQIERILRYKSDVEQEGHGRGEVNLLIYPEGTVKGVWNGRYDFGDGVERVIMAASFSGNTVPGKRYVGENGPDRSKLYLMAKGTYVIMESKAGSGVEENTSGYLYVTGWVEKDFTAVGDLYITRDRRTYERFDWGATPMN